MGCQDEDPAALCLLCVEAVTWLGGEAFFTDFTQPLQNESPRARRLRVIKMARGFLFSFPNFVELAAIVGGSPCERMPVCLRSIATCR